MSWFNSQFTIMKKEFSLATVFSVFLIFFSICMTSCGERNFDRVELDSGWKYSLTDPKLGDGVLKILPDEQLKHLEDFFSTGEGTVYLVKSFLIPSSLQKEDISCYLGQISCADRTYINHYLIGSTGFLQNTEYSSWNEARFYEIPEELLLPELNTITVEVHVKKHGFLRGSGFIALNQHAKAAFIADRFWNTQAYLVLAFLLLFTGFFSLKTFCKMQTRKDILIFLILVILAILNLSIIYASDIPFFSLAKKYNSIFLCINLHLIPALSIFVTVMFINSFFGINVTASKIVLRIFYIIIPQSVYFFLPEPYTYGYFELCSFLCFLPGILLIASLLIKELSNSVKYSFKLSCCFSAVLWFVGFDLFFHTGLKMNFLPYIAPAGWPVTLFAMFFLISGKKIDELKYKAGEGALVPVSPGTVSIPQPVQTAQPALPQKQVFSQRPSPVLDNYEIAYCFKPAKGSGQTMYDFFVDQDNLNGIALFETHGPENSSGIMAMLAKRIVAQKFREGKKQPLTRVMQHINEKILGEKESEDSYLTGLLLRFFENRIEYINVGNSPAFYRNGKTGRCVPVQINSQNYEDQGLMGIGKDTTPIEYQGIGFNINEGDALILYSKAFEAALNHEGEEFSRERIQQAFYQSRNEKASEKLDYILNMFQNFTRNIPVNQDLAVIIIQKK